MLSLRDLMSTLPQRGLLEWIGLRPAREHPMIVVEEAEVQIGKGLVGDRYSGNPASKRQVTLIQAEHLAAVGSLLRREAVDPTLVRRNLVIRGINLLALQQAKFRIGPVLLEGTGPCHPCSRMEAALGPGGYNAMRGHGGITARVLEPGRITVGDEVRMEPSDEVTGEVTK